MRFSLLVVLAACGGDSDLDAPDDCAADELHIVHGSLDERLTITNYGFVNALGSNSKGSLDVGMGGTSTVHLEFTKLTANGGTTDALGYVKLASGLDVGNCETGGYPSSLFIGGGGVYRFELRDVAMSPYCTGAAVAASVGGCYRSE